MNLRFVTQIVVAAAAMSTLPPIARGQILFESEPESNRIGKYDLATGKPINPSFISGLNSPQGIAISCGTLFVADAGNNRIGTYDVATGKAINASFISVGGQYLAISGGNLYVTTLGGSVLLYNATTGAPASAALVTGLHNPQGIVASCGILYVVSGRDGAGGPSGSIGEYDALTGAPINATLVSSGLKFPAGLALCQGNLYVANNGAGTIGKYNALTGAAVNSSFASTGANPNGLTKFGGNLFAAKIDKTIGKYNAKTGSTINDQAISLSSRPQDLVIMAKP